MIDARACTDEYTSLAIDTDIMEASILLRQILHACVLVVTGLAIDRAIREASILLRYILHAAKAKH